MSKIVVFGDLHFRDKEPYYSTCLKFINWFEDHELNSEDNVGFFLGDIFHKPRNTGKTNFLVKEFFFNILKFQKIFILRGNHDYSRREGDALKVFDQDPRIEVIREPKEFSIGENSILALPFLYPYSVTNITGERVTMKTLYENPDNEFYASKKWDYIFGHFGEESAGKYGKEADIPFIKGTRVFGHIHLQMSDVYLGTPYRTRYDERKRKKFELLSIDSETRKSVRFEIPSFLEYKTITFGDKMEEAEDHYTIWDIEDAPSKDSALEKYTDHCIREVRTKFTRQERTISEDTINSEGFNVKELFEKYAETNKVSKNVKNLILEEIG